jgi:hypothetical protein
MGDTFNFSSTQTGDGSVTQQAHTISGDAVTTVHNDYETEQELGRFFYAAEVFADMPTDEGTAAAIEGQKVTALVPQAIEQVTKDSPELLVDKAVAPDALPLNFVMSELGRQAGIPAAERDVPLIKQLLRVVHDKPSQVAKIIGRISLSFGKAWLTSMVAKNPVIAATIAAIDTAESLVSQETPPT